MASTPIDLGLHRSGALGYGSGYALTREVVEPNIGGKHHKRTGPGIGWVFSNKQMEPGHGLPSEGDSSARALRHTDFIPDGFVFR